MVDLVFDLLSKCSGFNFLRYEILGFVTGRNCFENQDFGEGVAS